MARRLSVSSPLGKTVLGAEEGDEVSFRLDDGHERKVLIENVAKGAPISGATTGNAQRSPLCNPTQCCKNVSRKPSQCYVFYFARAPAGLHFEREKHLFAPDRGLKNPERHPVAIALRRRIGVDDARVSKREVLIRRGKQWFRYEPPKPVQS